MLLYRCLISLAAPLILAVAVLRMGGLTARLGLVGPAVPGRHLWLHGASNGELASARPVIAALLARDPALRILITTNTVTGRRMARDWGMPGVEAQLAPLDLRWAVARVLRAWEVTALVIVENELWPNRLAAARRAGVPAAIIGGRLSARSAARWARWPGVIGPALGGLAWVSAQDDGSARRFQALGASPAQTAPTLDLKAFYRPPAPTAEDAALAPLYDRAQTVLAASTHPGEEAPVLAGFAEARARQSGLHLILAPRHPQRRDELVKLLRAQGLSFVQHSARQRRGAETAVTLADTLGDMPLWYRLSGRAFVGGSLVPKGGHTPYEPAAFGCAILHGPHTENFAAPYQMLAQAGAARAVTDAASLARALMALESPGAQEAMAAKAAQALPQPGDLEALLGRLAALSAPDRA